MKPEVVISVSSVVIAGIALIVGIWQGFVTRRHNRLSVRPHLRIDREEVVGDPIRILVRNTGVGPAFVDAFEMMLDGAPVAGDRITRMQVVMQRLGIASTDIRFGTFVVGEAIAAGESYPLIQIHTNAENHRVILGVIPRLTFSIAYRSIYDERFHLRQ